MPIPRELLTFWFCIFIAGPTLAADYWISIGSFKDRGAAEQGLIDAREAKLAEYSCSGPAQ